MKITVILTCYNRSLATVNCIRKLYNGNPNDELDFVVTEDACTDNTMQQLEKLQDHIPITVLHGTGQLYWCGGMRRGIAYAQKHCNAGAYMLVNDDVDFHGHILNQLPVPLPADTIWVGATCDEQGSFSYGGVCYTGHGIHYERKGPDYRGECDTFNANCVLIPAELFREGMNIDEHYIHSLGDFDYGLAMRRSGAQIRMLPVYVGVCSRNGALGTWLDTTLSRRQRLHRKESPKGAPFRQWFYFLKKNFGWGAALLHGFTPYLRILCGR